MANTISLMSNAIRNVVSKKRIRYKENGYNLDLTYISPNIIAMGFPAPDKLEGIYRNRYEDVFKFLEQTHGEHYKVYNLCREKSYDINKFHGRVAIYPFEDHNPPTIELIQEFCKDVDSWLKENTLNVVAVHCKAGKGRTGTMICAYLLYSGMQKTADDALAWYDEKRTKDRKGVTIPSQRRYVQYFSNLTCLKVPYKKISLNVCEIRFAETSFLRNMGTVQCLVYELQDFTNEKMKANDLKTWTFDFPRSLILELSNKSLTVAGDIKVELRQKSSNNIICHFWFNTFFVQNSAVSETHENSRKLLYTLKKCDIDDAHKDREHKSFSEDFKVLIVFETEITLEGKKMNKDKYRNRGENDFVVSSTSRLTEARAPYDMDNEESCRTKNQQIENIELDKTTHTNNQNDGVSTHSKNPSTAFKRKQPSTKSIPLPENNTASKNDIKKLHFGNQPSAKNSGFAKWQNDANSSTPKTRDLNDSGNILKYVGGSNKSLDQAPYLTCSKRSSPHANHNTGEGDEDWESGESSSVVNLATKVLPFNLPCSHSNKPINDQTKCNNLHKITLRENTTNNHMNPNPNPNPKRLDKPPANEKFLSNIKDNQQQRYDHPKIPLTIQNPYKDLHNKTNGRNFIFPRPLIMAKMPSCIKKFKKNKIKRTNSQNLLGLQNYFRSDSVNLYRNFITYRRNTFAGRCNKACKSKKNATTTTTTATTTIIPLSSSLSSSSSSSTSASASASATSISSSVSTGAMRQTHSTSCPIIFNNTSINLMKAIEKSKSTSALVTFRSHRLAVGNHNIAKNNSDDYYSKICDNLLSLNNSPCKSSRLLIAGSSLDNSKLFIQNRNQTTKQTTSNSNSNVVIVCTKPAEKISFGFNAESQINCFNEKHRIFNEKQAYTFPDLNRVVDNINKEQNTQHTLPPDIFCSVDFDNTYSDYEIKTNQTPNNLDILALDEDKSKDISSNVNVTTNYAEN